MLKCQECGGDTKAVEVKGARRLRECVECGERATSIEVWQPMDWPPVESKRRSDLPPSLREEVLEEWEEPSDVADYLRGLACSTTR